MTTRTSIYSNNSFTSLLIPKIRTSDTNSTGLDLQGYCEGVILFDIGDTGDTLSGSVKVELEIQESDDNSTFTAVADADLTKYVTGTNVGTVAVVDDNAEDETVYFSAYKGTKRYIRGVLNYTGTHTNGIEIGVIGIRGGANLKPINANT